MSKFLSKNKLVFSLQLTAYALIWYINFVIVSTYIPTLYSMADLSAATSKSGGMFLDFSKLYACSEIAKSAPQLIWDASTQAETLNKIIGAHQSDAGNFARTVYCAPYTPQSLLLIMPFTAFPLNQAIAIFEIFSLLLAIIAISFLLKKYQNYSLPKLLLWWYVIMAGFPFLQNLCLGQMTLILSGLMALFFLFWNSKNNFFAALSSALIIAIKPQRGLITLFIMLATKRYRLLIYTLICSLVLLGACAIFMGTDVLSLYPAKLKSIEAARHALQKTSPLEWTTAYYLGLPSFISFFWHKSIGHRLIIWSTIIDYVLIYLTWRKAYKFGPNTYPFAFAVTLLLDLLIGPYANLYDIFFLAIPWAMTLPQVELSHFSALKTYGMRLWYLAFSLFPICSWIIETYCLKFGGSLHMLMLSVIFLIAIINFREAAHDSKISSVPSISG